ncbi:Ankyrin repeat-containing protein [Rhodovulum sp. ES.010]|uniref:ankyrin repeat domain-containing protein n=1 Tax=Rhodovulum sp. ES.010 TaxID=1882821 RepID=UPI000925FA4B|nr:ankyrin repeat domain-containing protein [Rhodovulum sp. ES.010]SIO35811.1 Ankyrin repeat-containing protein [Rhodovulum sp. ES.010]
MCAGLTALFVRLENAAREGDFEDFEAICGKVENALAARSGSERIAARRRVAALRAVLVESPAFLAENDRLGAALAEAEAYGETARARRLSEALFRRGKAIMATMRQPEEEPEPHDEAVQWLFAAIEAGDLGETRARLRDADINARHGEIEATALGRALLVQGRAPEMVSLLLEAGADPSLGVGDGYGALHLVPAYPWGGEQAATTALIAHGLVAAGGDIEATTESYRWTPLHRAVMEGSAQELEALLRAGADPNRPFDGASEPWFTPGRLPLQIAGHDMAKVRLLLDHGADPSARDIEGRDVADYMLSLVAEHIARGTWSDEHRAGLEASLALIRDRQGWRN